MAQHKAHSPRRSVLIGALFTVVAALLAATLGAGAAGAYTPIAPGKNVVTKDSHVTGICNLTIESVNPSTGQVEIRLAAQARPTSLLGYGTNVYTQVFCTVYDAGNNAVASNNPFRNGPLVPNTASITAVPFSSSYQVCGVAFVKLNDGNQFVTTPVCSG